MMRNFFISSLEMVINVVVVVLAIGVVIGAIVAMMTPSYVGGGFLRGILVLIGGGVYVLIMGGVMYLGLGIHANTRRTAELLEDMARRP